MVIQRTKTLTKALDVTNNGTKLATYSYNSEGQYAAVALGNGVTENFGYNANGEIQSLVVANSDGPILDEHYTRDADGNITSITNGQTGASIDKYQYDAMNRLTQVTDSNGDVTQYTYDPLGNITKKTVTPAGGTATTTLYTYNAGNELTAVNGQAYTYNADGELTSDGKYDYKWNELGELIEVDNASSGSTVATYQYDASGRRTSQTANGNTTKYFYIGGSNLVAYETDGSGNLVRSYTYSLTGAPLTMTTWSGGTGTTYYYHENEHGDVVALSDGSGKTVATYSYDAWGNIVSSSGALASVNPYRYAGYRYDSATSMYYLNARYYNPSIMRFISQDPVGGMNEYAYADNNPIMKIDPSGEWSFWDTVAAIGIGVAAVALAATGVGLIADAAIFGEAAADEGMLLVEADAEEAEVADETAIDRTKTSIVKRTVKKVKRTVHRRVPKTAIRETRKSDPLKLDLQRFAARGSNNLKPDPVADGSHTVFTRDSSGKITHYQTYHPQSNPYNPNPWEEGIRYDATGARHFNKVTRSWVDTPHVHDPSVPGGVRFPFFNEIP